MRAEDRFRVGIVVDDLESALAALSDVFGYEWCDEVDVPTPVTFPSGVQVVDMRFAYSKTSPPTTLDPARGGEKTAFER